jgi:riboflavin synthase alpha subunit
VLSDTDIPRPHGPLHAGHVSTGHQDRCRTVDDRIEAWRAIIPRPECVCGIVMKGTVGADRIAKRVMHFQSDRFRIELSAYCMVKGTKYKRKVAYISACTSCISFLFTLHDNGSFNNHVV